MKRAIVPIIAGSLILFVLALSGCGPQGHMGEKFIEHILSCMDGRVEKLNLNEEQEAKYLEIRSTIKDNMKEAAARRFELRENIVNEFQSENPHIEKIAGYVKELLAEVELSLTDNVDVLVGFYNILDNDQQAVILNGIQEKVNKFHSRHREG